LLANPRHVTEFGSGEYSTALFLNREVFPKVTSLVSLENDATWYARMQSQSSGDSRLELRQISGDLSESVNEQLLATDLIFIDDSGHEIRKHTIRAVGKKAPDGVPVVIHDAEYPWTRMAIRRAFDHCYVFSGFQPQTALAWNGNLRFSDQLLQISRRITIDASTIPPSNGEQWIRALSLTTHDSGNS
jgi:hypothetical protein